MLECIREFKKKKKPRLSTENFDSINRGGTWAVDFLKAILTAAKAENHCSRTSPKSAKSTSCWKSSAHLPSLPCTGPETPGMGPG